MINEDYQNQRERASKKIKIKIKKCDKKECRREKKDEGRAREEKDTERHREKKNRIRENRQ